MSTTSITPFTGQLPDTSPAGPRRRTGTGLAGQLNTEWDALVADPATAAAVAAWAAQDDALARCATLADIEVEVAGAGHADDVLLALVRLAQAGDTLAGRTVLQLMLGKAIRIAASYAGRDTREHLEQIAVTALWTTIATYPVERRPVKVAANIAMDTLHAVSHEFGHRRAELPTEPSTLAAVLAGPVDLPARGDRPADLELLELLAWAVDHHHVTAADATLIMDIYAPGPGCRGGEAAATRHGLSWPAARQRASRAVRKIARAVHADTVAA